MESLDREWWRRYTGLRDDERDDRPAIPREVETIDWSRYTGLPPAPVEKAPEVPQAPKTPEAQALEIPCDWRGGASEGRCSKLAVEFWTPNIASLAIQSLRSFFCVDHGINGTSRRAYVARYKVKHIWGDIYDIRPVSEFRPTCDWSNCGAEPICGQPAVERWKQRTGPSPFDTYFCADHASTGPKRTEIEDRRPDPRLWDIVPLVFSAEPHCSYGDCTARATGRTTFANRRPVPRCGRHAFSFDEAIPPGGQLDMTVAPIRPRSVDSITLAIRTTGDDAERKVVYR